MQRNWEPSISRWSENGTWLSCQKEAIEIRRLIRFILFIDKLTENPSFAWVSEWKRHKWIVCALWDLHKISRARSIVWAREKCKKRIKKRRKRLISHNSRDFQLMNCSNKIDLFLFASIFTSSPYHTPDKPGRAESKPKIQAFLCESFTVPHSRAKISPQPSCRRRMTVRLRVELTLNFFSALFVARVLSYDVWQGEKRERERNRFSADHINH